MIPQPRRPLSSGGNEVSFVGGKGTAVDYNSTLLLKESRPERPPGPQGSGLSWGYGIGAFELYK